MAGADRERESTRASELGRALYVTLGAGFYSEKEGKPRKSSEQETSSDLLPQPHDNAGRQGQRRREDQAAGV